MQPSFFCPWNMNTPEWLWLESPLASPWQQSERCKWPRSEEQACNHLCVSCLLSPPHSLFKTDLHWPSKGQLSLTLLALLRTHKGSLNSSRGMRVYKPPSRPRPAFSPRCTLTNLTSPSVPLTLHASPVGKVSFSSHLSSPASVS